MRSGETSSSHGETSSDRRPVETWQFRRTYPVGRIGIMKTWLAQQMTARPGIDQI